MLNASLEMLYRCRVRGPLPEVRGPLGVRQYWEVEAASLQGSRIHAEAALPGGDWMRVGEDGFWRPDVRLQMRTDDDVVVLVQYQGLVQQNSAFLRAARDNTATNFETNYMRMQMTFETGDARYSWLTQHLFVAKGRLLGTHELEYEVYRVE